MELVLEESGFELSDPRNFDSNYEYAKRSQSGIGTRCSCRSETQMMRTTASGSEERERYHSYAVLAPVCLRAGVQNDLLDHLVAELALEPGQVPAVIS